MTSYVALLRAVNVSGTAKLPSAELKRIGEECGFDNVRTFIASGNLLFSSSLDEAQVGQRIEAKLEEFFGRRAAVLVRTADEMAAIAGANPFRDEAPNRVVTVFLAEAPPADAAERATGVNGERIALGKREIYVFYANGIAGSKLKIPGAAEGTARNANTAAKLAALAAECA